MSLPKRLKALQGLWVESTTNKGRGKTWLIEGENAMQQVADGKRGKKYTLTKGENGDVLWGKGTFVLASSFKSGNAVADWMGEGGEVGFSWKRLDSGSGSAEVKDKDEKRVDPTDGKAYTLKELQNYYSTMFGTAKIEATSYWLTCKATGKAEPKAKSKAKAKAKSKAASEAGTEQRIDPTDGQAYTFADMKSFYSETWTKKAMDEYFSDCKVQVEPKAKAKAKAKSKAAAEVADSGEEKRKDPTDGKAYTWEELRQHYSATYTKKGFAEFWEGCKPSGKQTAGRQAAEPKAKAKVKAKAKAEPKAKAKTKAAPKWTVKQE